MQLAEIQRRPLTDRNRLAKTALDYGLAALGLVVLAPVFLIVAIAIKLETRGSVFFRQSRHGLNHAVISVLKFRTMRDEDDGTVRQAEVNDPRVTAVGRILRRTSIDELPQLVNVLRGEMSLVGPRPHALVHNQHYATLVERYANRHKVKPGITGLAQVSGCRGETRDPERMRERIAFDLDYIENWSIRRDFEILFRSVWVAANGQHAH